MDVSDSEEEEELRERLKKERTKVREFERRALAAERTLSDAKEEHGEELREREEELDRVREERNRVVEENAQLKAEVAALRSSSGAGGSGSASKAALQRLQTELEEAESRFRVDLSAKDAERAGLEEELFSARAARDAARSRVGELESMAEDREERIRSLVRELEEVRVHASGAGSREHRLEREKRALAAGTEQALEQVRRQERVASGLRAQLGSLVARLQEAMRDADSSRAELVEIRNENVRLFDKVSELERRYEEHFAAAKQAGGAPGGGAGGGVMLRTMSRTHSMHPTSSTTMMQPTTSSTAMMYPTSSTTESFMQLPTSFFRGPERRARSVLGKPDAEAPSRVAPSSPKETASVAHPSRPQRGRASAMATLHSSPTVKHRTLRHERDADSARLEMEDD